ncbi:dCTP deaminase [Synechococcus elongatus]|uniref:dCTP deaminase n=1 Tax=Synechococcus elongatus TaxID=32046 RepID=UPI000F7D9D66|nr:dCTP deaminase [Synechococcus elongatus]
MGLLCDREIEALAVHHGAITPFVPELIRKTDIPVISYGLSSYGYDLRLSPREFLIFRHIPGTVINPKAFNPANLELAQLQEDEYGEFFILPGNSYGLGVAIEHLNVPHNVTVIILGKSTYARCGLICNCTPAEARWRGHLTLEFSNSSAADCRVYVNEGVAQALFLQGENCKTSYEDRAGKYQDQGHCVVLAKL